MPLPPRDYGRSPARRVACAFTLVELLVVIAVIGILIALLLPAVQAARESARRVQCVANVKQVALAIQNYEAAKKKLPAAGSYDSIFSAAYFQAAYWRIQLQSGPNHSWVVHLLPYLEEQPLHDQFKLAEHVTSILTDPQAAQPPVLLCPSDATQGRYYESRVDEGYGVRDVNFGKANIAAFVNPYHIDAYFHPGAIALYGHKLTKILDGTSTTLAIAEIRTRDHVEDHRGSWALPWSGATLLSMDLHPIEREDQNDGIEGGPKGYEPDSRSLGLTQFPNSVNPDVLYKCPDLAGEQLDAMPCTSAWAGYISAAPRSLHPGGVNAAYLDGHVAFLPDTIDEMAMFYMVNIKDGTVLSERY